MRRAARCVCVCVNCWVPDWRSAGVWLPCWCVVVVVLEPVWYDALGVVLVAALVSLLLQVLL